MEPLVLDSEIPASHPEKQAIEEAIREALAGRSGWKVHIEVASRAPLSRGSSTVKHGTQTRE
jgi:hypothetical protein